MLGNAATDLKSSLRTKKIMILYGSSGGGHKSVAYACAQALEARGITKNNITIIDAVTHTSLPARALNTLYNKGAYHLWNAAYHTLNTPSSVATFNTLFTHNRQGLYTILAPHNADIIISTYQFSSEMIAYGRRNKVLTCPTVTVVTDPFTTHTSWLQKDIDYYWCCSKRTQKFLINKKIDPKHITVGGMPCALEHTQPLDAKKIRAQLGLGKEQCVVLISNWSAQPSTLTALINSLASFQKKVACLVVCSHNSGLYKALEAQKFAVPVKLFKHINTMHELMAASDLFVGKAGPTTMAECFIHGLPIAIMQPLMPQELPNMHYALKHQVGSLLQKPQDLPSLVKQLIESPQLKKEKRARALSLAKPFAALDLADFIIDILTQQEKTNAHTY